MKNYIATIYLMPAKPKRKPVLTTIKLAATSTRSAIISAITTAKEMTPTRKLLGVPRVKILE